MIAGQERLALGERPVLARVVKVRRLAVGVVGARVFLESKAGTDYAQQKDFEDLLFLKRRLE